MNPFVRILVAVILPLFIAIILAVIVLSFAGFNVLGWAEEKMATAPIISTLVKTEDEKSLTEQLEAARETIEQQKNEIEQLEDEVTALEGQLENIELEL